MRVFEPAMRAKPHEEKERIRLEKEEKKLAKKVNIRKVSTSQMEEE
jgi:hypothetical protein